MKDFVAVLTRVLCLRAILVLVGVSAWFLLAGCQTLGRAALGAGRGAYNDVIARTSSEQTLGLIVRLRYSDPIGLLAVSGVTAGLKFSTQAKIVLGAVGASIALLCMLSRRLSQAVVH